MVARSTTPPVAEHRGAMEEDGDWTSGGTARNAIACCAIGDEQRQERPPTSCSLGLYDEQDAMRFRPAKQAKLDRFDPHRSHRGYP